MRPWCKKIESKQCKLTLSGRDVVIKERILSFMGNKNIIELFSPQYKKRQKKRSLNFCLFKSFNSPDSLILHMQIFLLTAVSVYKHTAWQHLVSMRLNFEDLYQRAN